MTDLSVLHVTADLHPASGGTSVAVSQLADAAAEIPGVRVALLFQHRSGEPALLPSSARVDSYMVVTESGILTRTGLGLRKRLKELTGAHAPSLMHNHGLWLPVNHWAARVARQTGTPLITHVHGMLEPWALGHKPCKKRFAMLAYQSADIGVAKALIATSAKEYENLRSLGLKQPIAVIPNGVKLPEKPHEIENSRGRGENGTRKVSFMSRIHPVKGLLNLVNAWSRIEPDGWTLNIAGPGEGPYLDEVQSLVRTLQLSDSVKILGELKGAAKSEFLRDSDIFVLPSFSENFGIVVAEALAYGVPVITTTGAPWAILEDYDCGWQVDVGVNPMVAALRKAILLSDDQRMEMGQRGRILAQRYNWGVIAGQTADVYRWVLGQQSRPDCVHLA